MKEMFKGLGDFLVGLTKLIIICGAVVLLVRGLDWLFEKTLPLNAIGIPPLILSIIVLCGIVLLLIWVMEKRDKKDPVKRESNPLTEFERQEWNSNFNRGWLCLLTGFAVLMMTLDMDNIQARLALCAIAAIAAWPVTVIRKVKKRPGLYALALLCLWLIYGGGCLVWDGMTHVGPGVWTYGGGGGDMYPDTDEFQEVIPEGQYKRECYTDGVMLILFGAVVVGTLIHLWREKDKEDELEKSRVTSKAGEFGLSFQAWNTLMDLITETKSKKGVTVADRVGAGIAEFKKHHPGERFDEAGVEEFLTGSVHQGSNFPNKPQTYSIAAKQQIKGLTTPKNTMKTKILIATLAAFILTCLFPPWLNVLDVPYHAHQRTPAGHEFFLFPPDSKGGAWSVEVDLKMLFVEWAALAAITGAVWLIVVKPPWLRDDKANRPHKFIPPPGNSKN